MASQIALLLLLGVACVGFATAEVPVDCCLTISKKPLPLQIIISYSIQDAGKGCDIKATAFITKAGRSLCVSHPHDETWVRNHIKYLEERKQRHH